MTDRHMIAQTTESVMQLYHQLNKPTCIQDLTNQRNKVVKIWQDQLMYSTCTYSQIRDTCSKHLGKIFKKRHVTKVLVTMDGLTYNMMFTALILLKGGVGFLLQEETKEFLNVNIVVSSDSFLFPIFLYSTDIHWQSQFRCFTMCIAADGFAFRYTMVLYFHSSSRKIKSLVPDNRIMFK